LRLTEAEWVGGTHPYPMLDYLRARTHRTPDRRRVRLFSCACAREVWDLLTDDRSRQAIEVAERFADGQATDAEFVAAARAATAAAWPLRKSPDKDAAHTASGATTGDEALWGGVSSTFEGAARTLANAATKKAAAREAHQTATRERQAILLRCLFANPFRPIALPESCRKPALVALARTAYDARILPGGQLDPAKLAALADALDRAGAPAEALEHLRGSGPHARGCWVVDAVLGQPVTMPEAVTPPSPKKAEPPKVNEFTPGFGGENEDGTFSLGFTDFDGTAAIFAELGHEGGGYGWHGVVDALVRMKAPKVRRKLRYDPEASMFVVLSKDREAIRQVAALIRAAVDDPALLREAIAAADPDLMDG
jgi:hypothetical protein